MNEVLLKAHCMSCHKDFGIRQVEPMILCPSCHQEADIIAICTKCNGRFYTNERSLGCAFPCPNCNEQIICNVLERLNGTPIVVPWSDRVELHDLMAAMSVSLMGMPEEVRKQDDYKPKRTTSESTARRFDRSHTKDDFSEVTVTIKNHRAAFRKKEPSKVLLRLCEQRILREWAYLDDLPRELANTVANIYYNHCELNAFMAALKTRKINHEKMFRLLGIDKVERDLGLTAPEVIAHYIGYVEDNLKAIDEVINSLRQIDEKQTPQEYRNKADFAVVTMKYGIDPKIIMDGNEEIVRRQFQTNPVDEIPNLIDLLQL